MLLVHIYQSWNRSVTGPCGTALLLTTARWARCGHQSLCVKAELSVRLNLSGWLAVLAADALSGASIMASPPFGHLEMQSLQKKPAVIQSSRQKQM